MPESLPRVLSSCSPFNSTAIDNVNQELPRVKLTGSGKMPVMDIRSNNIVQNYTNVPYSLEQSQYMINHKQQSTHSRESTGNSNLVGGGLHPPVTGLPPKSPVYAVINKASKHKVAKQSSSDNVAHLLSPDKDRTIRYIILKVLTHGNYPRIF